MTDLIDLIDLQLSEWRLARENYQSLGKTRRRSLRIGDLTFGIQHNPARIVSTGAKTDSQSISQRPCFLCRENRPKEQRSFNILNGWELLINPYPIFPTHFTIVSTCHTPQAGWQAEMCVLAEKLPGHTIFFNGSKSGASCPDHLHLQAVKTEELPLMKLIEERHDASQHHVMTEADLQLDLPFGFKSFIIMPDSEGMELLKRMEQLIGDKYLSKGKLNLYAWIDRSGLLRIVSVPRKAHRPSCYGAGEDQHLISPGCIDMAGIIVAPLEKDYLTLGKEEIIGIYEECGEKHCRKLK